jgi:hypothetical protein
MKMPRLYAIHKKDHSYTNYSLEALCDDLNDGCIKTSQYSFFVKESEAIKYQYQLINKKKND